MSGDSVQQWVGKDFFNPFIKDFVELDKPFGGMLCNISVCIVYIMHWCIALCIVHA